MLEELLAPPGVKAAETWQEAEMKHCSQATACWAEAECFWGSRRWVVNGLCHVCTIFLGDFVGFGRILDDGMTTFLGIPFGNLSCWNPGLATSLGAARRPTARGPRFFSLRGAKLRTRTSHVLPVFAAHQLPKSEAVHLPVSPGVSSGRACGFWSAKVWGLGLRFYGLGWSMGLGADGVLGGSMKFVESGCFGVPLRA